MKISAATDGSVMNGKAGCAAVIFVNEQPYSATKMHLGPDRPFTSSQAEYWGVLAGLRTIEQILNSLKGIVSKVHPVIPFYIDFIPALAAFDGSVVTREQTILLARESIDRIRSSHPRVVFDVHRSPHTGNNTLAHRYAREVTGKETDVVLLSSTAQKQKASG